MEAPMAPAPMMTTSAVLGSIARSAEAGHDLLAEEAQGSPHRFLGKAPAREGAHEVGDAQGVRVLADLVRDLLGLAHDGGLVEGLLLRQREQVLPHALVELVLLGRDAGGV